MPEQSMVLWYPLQLLQLKRHVRPEKIMNCFCNGNTCGVDTLKKDEERHNSLKAAQITRYNNTIQIKVNDVPIPEMGDHDVLIRVKWQYQLRRHWD